jgi:hypothetical protein
MEPLLVDHAGYETALDHVVSAWKREQNLLANGLTLRFEPKMEHHVLWRSTGAFDSEASWKSGSSTV